MVFQRKPLKVVLEEFGRYYHASNTVTAAKILDAQVSDIFPSDNLPQALQATAMPIKLTQTSTQS